MEVGTRAQGALLVAGAAWVVAVWQMRGMMDAHDLGGFAWYAGVWVTMTVAMMLPAALPTLSLFGATGGATVPFAVGYLLVWTTFGLAAYGLARSVPWDPGRTGAGIALVAGGVYQLTPLKRACLRWCRSPLAFLRRHGRAGLLGAVRTGVAHGAYCLGCCAGLMLVLFAVGVMSVAWMAVVAGVILEEKLLPRGERLAPLSAVALVVAGVWVAL